MTVVPLRVVPVRGPVCWQHRHPTPQLRWCKGVLEQLFIVEDVAADRVTITDIRQEWRAVPTEDGA